MNILPSWALLAWLAIPGADGGAVWIEGEAPGSINFTPVVSGWGRKEFLSGEKWLHVAVDADKVARDVPSGGITIRYHFRVGAARDYEVWDRVGFEFVRSPIAWRVDGGAWSTVGPEVLTTDLMELDFFCEVAWLKLGSRTLAAGEHALEIRLDRSKGGNGKDERILYSSDALCIHPGPFHPDGKARFVAVDHRPAGEEPCDEYPVWFITGRYKEHYNSGAQTRRVAKLVEAQPVPRLEIHPRLAKRLKIGPGEAIAVESRRGRVVFEARLTPDIRVDTVFAPFHWGGAGSANILTNPALDPTSRMPEFKLCAVRLAPAPGLAAEATPSPVEPR